MKRALESVLSQTFTNFTVCIYDNSSDSKTEKIVKALAEKDKRISYHRHKENIGATPNFAFGLSRVNTPFFSFLSDDDILLPNFFENALKGFDRYPKAGFFCGTIIWSNAFGKVINVTTNSWKNDEYYEPPEGLFEMIPKHLDWMGALFRKEILDKIGGIDTRVKAIDVDFLFKAAAKFPFIVSKEPCGIFFQHLTSYSSYAGLKLIWPSYLHILDNIKNSATLSPSAVLQLENLFKSDMPKKILFVLIHNLKRKEYSAALETIAVLKSHFKLPVASFFLKVLVKIMQSTSLFYYLMLLMLKVKNLVTKRKKVLQNSYAHYLHFIQNANHE